MSAGDCWINLLLEETRREMSELPWSLTNNQHAKSNDNAIKLVSEVDLITRSEEGFVLNNEFSTSALGKGEIELSDIGDYGITLSKSEQKSVAPRRKSIAERSFYFCIETCTWRVAFDWLVTCLNIANILLFHVFFDTHGPFCRNWEQLSFDSCGGTTTPFNRCYVVCLWVFSVEVVVNVFYAEERGKIWKVFHTLLTLSAWLEFIPEGRFARLSLTLRVIDILRIMKKLNIMHGASVVISTVLKAIERTIPVLMLGLLCIFSTATLCLHIFVGAFQQNCFHKNSHGMFRELPDHETIPISQRTCGGNYQCPAQPKSYDCYIHGISPENNITFANPIYGFLNYNTLGASIMQIVVSITSAAWAQQAFIIMNSVGWFSSFIFCIFVAGAGEVILNKFFLASVKYEFALSLSQLEEKRIVHGWTHRRQVTLVPRLNPCGCHRGTVRKKVFELVTSRRFHGTMIVVILANAISLSMYRVDTRCDILGNDDGSDCITHAVPMRHRLYSRLTLLETIFASIFVAEFLLVLWGRGARKYFKSWARRLDFFLVIISLFEFHAVARGYGEGAFRTILRSLKALRVLRVFRIRTEWKSLDALLLSFEDAASRLLATLGVILFFIYIFALIGMRLFGLGSPCNIPGDTHYNFKTTFNGILNVFQVLTGVHWPSLLWHTLKYTSGEYHTIIYWYFGTLVFIGQKILFFGFISQLLITLNFGKPGEEMHEAWKKATTLVTLSRRRASLLLRSVSRKQGGSSEDPIQLVTEVTDVDAADALREDTSLNSDDDYSDKIIPGPRRRRISLAETFVSVRPSKALARIERENKKLQKLLEAKRRNEKLRGKTLGVFGPENRMRIFLAKILRSKYCESVILITILGSCLVLVLQATPLGEENNANRDKNMASIVFTAIFTLEIVAKLVVSGVKHFFRSKDGNWNTLDFVVVAASLISYVATAVPHELQSLKNIRVLRILRPLRAVRRMPGLKVAIDSLKGAAPTFINILFVATFIIMIFAIVMLHACAGRFWSCNDKSVSNWRECTGVYRDGEYGFKERKWKNSPMNFDNIGSALLTSFQISTRSQYYIPMWDAMDQRAVLGDQPQLNNNAVELMAIPFLVFIITASYMVMALFIGAIIREFQNSRHKNQGSVALTENQRILQKTLQMVTYLQPPMRYCPPPQSSKNFIYYVRATMYRICSKTDRFGNFIFDDFVCCIILIHTSILASSRFQEDSSNEFWLKTSATSLVDLHHDYDLLVIVNIYFVVFYVVELAMKIIAMGSLKQWLYFRWNQFDFFAVMLSVLTIFGSHPIHLRVGDSRLIVILNYLCTFRIFKVVRLLPKVRLLFNVLGGSLAAVSNLGLLLTIFLFIFSLIAIDIFGDLDTNKKRYYGSYNEVWNYKDFGSAFLTNLRWALNGGQSDWAAFCHDIMTEKPAAWIYFVIFIVLITHLLMNIIVAVILEEFDAVQRHEKNLSGYPLASKEMRAFANLWSDFDVQHHMWIPSVDVQRFFDTLKKRAPHLHIKSGFDVISVTKLKHDGQGRCLFLDVFITWCLYSFHTIDQPEILSDAMLLPICHSLTLAFGIRDEDGDGDEGEVIHDCASATIMRVARRWLEQKKNAGSGSGSRRGN